MSETVQAGMEAAADSDGIVTTTTGPDQYEIIATARLDCSPAPLWKLLCDWERFVAIGLPGLSSEFHWRSGGPGQAPSKFEFSVAGTVLKEEIYELAGDESSRRYRLRYRALEPALGVLEYDAVLDLEPVSDEATFLRALRTVRLEPGSSPELLAGMVADEMQCLRDHFASQKE